MIFDYMYKAIRENRKFQNTGGSEMAEKISNVSAIRNYFAAGKWGRKVEMKELKVLSQDERQELGDMAREALDKGWD